MQYCRYTLDSQYLVPRAELSLFSTLHVPSCGGICGISKTHLASIRQKNKQLRCSAPHCWWKYDGVAGPVVIGWSHQTPFEPRPLGLYWTILPSLCSDSSLIGWCQKEEKKKSLTRLGM